MKISRSFALDLAAGLLLSSIFCILLVRQIMAGGVGDSISFGEFLSAPENVISSLLMSSFIIASWLIKGINNRIVIFCWALLSVLFYVLYYWIFDYFYYGNKNIYVVVLAGLICTLPAVLFLRYRVTYTLIIAQQLWKIGLFRTPIEQYLRHAKVTDFERRMRQNIYLALGVEFIYGAYQTVYAKLYEIPSNGSIYKHMMSNNHWDPFDLYTNLSNLIGCIYIVIIAYHIYRSYESSDALMHGVSRERKREIALKILEERRQKTKKKRNQDQLR